MTNTIPTANISMDSILTMLNEINRFDRRWLIEQMMEQIAKEESEAEKDLKGSLKSRPTREEEDNKLLDSVLSRISGDWGGEREPKMIAKELRQGSDMIRKVESW